MKKLRRVYRFFMPFTLLLRVATCTPTGENIQGVNPSVASVSVNPPSSDVMEDDSTRMVAVARDASGNPLPGHAISWTSSDTSLAKVSSEGVVTGVAPGAVTITAASDGKKGSGSVSVKRAPVATVTVTPPSGSITPGQTIQLSATLRGSSGNVLKNRSVTWSSSTPAVATVNGNGLVTGVAAGTATITATSEGKSGTADITVTTVVVPVASVVVAPASGSITIGQAIQLDATARDAGGATLTGRVVTWSSGSPAVATVNASGRVTGVAAGSVTITATSEGKSGTSAITVSVVPVASVTVSPTSGNITAGKTIQLSATTRDAAGATLTGRAVAWSSGNTGVATVNSSGLVTGVAAGSVTITATSEGKSATSSITVTPVPVASVTVSPSSGGVTAGQTLQLSAVTRDAGGATLTGRTVTWTSSNGAVATVNASGLVTGVAAGSATITATSEGKTGTSAITVTAASGGGSGGGTILLSENFENMVIGPGTTGWYDYKSTPLVTTQPVHPGGTGSKVLEIHFLAGATNSTWGGIRHKFTATSTLYFSYWIKYSSNWVGSGKPYHPHEFSFMTNENGDYDSPANNHLTIYVEHNYQSGGGYPVLATQDGTNIDQTKINVDLTNVSESRAVSGCNGNTDGYPTTCYAYQTNPTLYVNGKTWTGSQPAFLPNPGAGYKGDWHFVEVYAQMNSIVNGKGVSDGIYRYSVDGTVLVNKTNVLFRTGVHANQKFDHMMILPYIGDGSPVDQTAWVDDITVATAKP